MDSKEIGRRIHEARLLREMSLQDVANKVHVARSTIQRYESGRIETVKLPVIEAIAKALNVSPGWLTGKENSMETISQPPSTKGVTINVLGRVAAGIPIDAIEYIIDTEEISQDMAARGSYFGLQIKGDSMEPKISDGDIVIVRQQEDAESGDLVIALVNGEDATCKRLRKHDNGVSLISTNPKYEPMFFTDKEVQEKPVKIIGKVVELRAKF